MDGRCKWLVGGEAKPGGVESTSLKHRPHKYVGKVAMEEQEGEEEETKKK